MKLLDGYTLMHEHITLDLSKLKEDEDCNLNCFEQTVKELKILYKYGVRNILDVTNIGMGRNIDYIQKVSKETGINIILSTGFYKEPFLPEFVYNLSIEDLVNMIEAEILKGIGNTNIKASIIGEIGTSKNKMTKMEQKVFDAMAIVHLKTKAPITTHTTLGTYALEQAKYLINKGVKPEKIIIGHIDLSKDINYILKVLEMGVNVGFDTIGKLNYCNDIFRLEALKEIDRQNMLSKVVLSMDITRKSHLKYKDGIGYLYIFEKFIPFLKENGFTQDKINLLLKDNPKKILM